MSSFQSLLFSAKDKNYLSFTHLFKYKLLFKVFIRNASHLSGQNKNERGNSGTRLSTSLHRAFHFNLAAIKLLNLIKLNKESTTFTRSAKSLGFAALCIKSLTCKKHFSLPLFFSMLLPHDPYSL